MAFTDASGLYSLVCNGMRGAAKASCDQAASHYKPIGAQTNQGFTPGTSGLPGRWTGGGPAPKLRSYQETQQVLQIQAQAIATAEQMESERMSFGDVLWNTATGTAYEFFVADFVNCYEDPNILDCGAAAASLIPGYGKLGKAASVADDVVALASKGDELATVADDLAGITDDVASKADDVATKSDDVAPTTARVNGETPATALGRQKHAEWDYGPGYVKEYRLPSGRRVDAINFETRVVIELKPDNPRAIRLGEQQVQQYVDELNSMLAPGEQPWSGSVVTYGAN